MNIKWKFYPALFLCQVSLAAVKCLHSLSRSVQQLRTTFKDHVVWKPLLKLVQHANLDIKIVAASTVCNLTLEFSPSKEPILENGGLEIIAGLTHHENSNLRLNGAWALMVKPLQNLTQMLFNF